MESEIRTVSEIQHISSLHLNATPSNTTRGQHDLVIKTDSTHAGSPGSIACAGRKNGS